MSVIYDKSQTKFTTRTIHNFSCTTKTLKVPLKARIKFHMLMHFLLKQKASSPSVAVR